MLPLLIIGTIIGIGLSVTGLYVIFRIADDWIDRYINRK